MVRRTTEYEECEPIVRGAVHELEHTDDWETAMDIASDHLREREDYYAVLEAAMGEEVRPNRIDLSDQRWRRWYYGGEWEVVPKGMVHSQAAEMIVRRYPEELEEYRNWNRQRFPRYEEYLLSHRGVKQWGLMFFTGPKPPWKHLQLIQRTVLEMQPSPSDPVDIYLGYESDSEGYEMSVEDFVNARNMRDLQAAGDAYNLRPNVATAAAGAVATLLLPYALDLAMKYPREAGRLLNYAAMVAFPPYGLARAGYAAGTWVKGKIRRRLGISKNPAVTESLGHLSPSMRRTVENLLKWMVEAFQLAKQGVERAHIIQWLRQNGIASRLANAMADAVIGVLAQEAAEGVRSGGRRIARRALGEEVPRPVASNPADPSARYYVWSAEPGSFAIEEGPLGPYPLLNAKTYARIAATKGELHRLVTRGSDPSSSSFDVVRIYEAGTGERLDVEAE